MKFKDAELLGIPLQLVVGRGFKQGKVELTVRRSGERREIPLEDVISLVKEKIELLP